MADNIPSGYAGLEGWEEGKAPPKRRVKDAKSAHALYIAARDGDRENALNRRIVQEMKDGEPPYDDGELEELGHTEAVNLNFLEGSAIIEAALSSYNDLTSSVDTLVTCHTTFGDPSERVEFSQVISEEFTRMNKEWSRFEFNVQSLADKFVTHGVAVAFHDDDIDWRWKVAGLGDFKLPRDAEACEEELDHAIATRNYTVSKLNRYIENPTVATANRWNVDAVKKLIWSAYHSGSESPTPEQWEEFQVQIKNNDLFVGYSKSPRVRINHYYVEEFDGTWSHFLGDEAGQLEDFLYEFPNRFKRVSDCFTIFTYGIGNGFYHGVRGLGYKIFPQIQVSNRLRCRLVEGGMLGSSLLIQPQSAEDLESMNLVYYGPYAVIPPNMKVLERTVPNFAQNVMPIVSDLSRQMQNNTGSYQSRAVTPEGNQERTKFEVQAQIQHESTLSTSAMNLLYLPWKRKMQASFRRIQNRNYRQDDPGGVAVFEMRRRCAARGVPVEAIYAVDRVEPVRAIGYGSPGNRLLALDEINNLSPQFDPVGRRMALRDRVAVRVGYETADRYVPRDPSQMRPPIDAKIAELEDTALEAGSKVTVQIGEMHSVHLGQHMGSLSSAITAVTSGQAQPPAMMPYFAVALPHCAEHLQNMSQDPMAQGQVKQIEQGLQVLFQAVQEIQKALMAQMDAEQKQMQAQQAEQMSAAGEGQAPDPALALKLDEHAVKMKILQEQNQVKLTLAAQQASQKMHIRDEAQKLKIQTQHAGFQQAQALKAEAAASPV